MSDTKEVRAYYFGCVNGPGHYMHKPDLGHDWHFLRANPWGINIDDGFKGLRYMDGWTALAIRDYSVDSRPGSNSVFLAEGDYTAAQMAEIAKQQFPSIAKRVHIDLFTGEDRQ